MENIFIRDETNAFKNLVNNEENFSNTTIIAEKGFQGILDHLVEVEPNGMVNLEKCCAVAGLGGDRDGSFEYYINEEVRANDPKGTGPFIMASLELNK